MGLSLYLAPDFWQACSCCVRTNAHLFPLQKRYFHTIKSLHVFLKSNRFSTMFCIFRAILGESLTGSDSQGTREGMARMTGGRHDELLFGSTAGIAPERLPIQAPISLNLIMVRFERSSKSEDV